MPEPDQPGRELRDVYALAAGVDASSRSQWARVFRNQCDAQGRSHPSAVVLKSTYPAPLLLNPRPCGVLAIVDVHSAARRWAETWQRAWPAKQPAEIAALYHQAASYRSSPLRDAEPGGALAYVERQFAIEEAVECRFAEPIAAGDRAAVEWWASFIEAGQAITLAGATVLRFDSDGLVVDHVDYWVQSPGRTVPYAGWGKAGPLGGSKGGFVR